MKKTLLIVLAFYCLLCTQAQGPAEFQVVGKTYRLVELSDWLRKGPGLPLSYNPGEKKLQVSVTVTEGSYSFDRLFQKYYRPAGLNYKTVGNQIIIYAITPGDTLKRKHTVGVTINGYVTDSASGERLQGVTIAVLNTSQATTSNNYGFYSLQVPPDAGQLVVSSSGYEPLYLPAGFTRDTVLNLPLQHRSNTLEVVTVTSSRSSVQTTGMGHIDMPIETIKAMPKLLGETDVLRALSFLAGVQTGSEISAGLNVRGGSPDQNLILLDGAPVYNASHLFGIFSVFNADALKSVQFYKGGFPARYGGRLSSVIDLYMKEGNKNKWQGEGALGLLSSRLTVEGPLKKGKSSLMISGRTTNWGPLIQYITKKSSDGDSKGNYGFFDLNVKSNFYLSPKDQLYVSSYFGRDNFYDRYGLKSPSTAQDALHWGNITATTRWNHQFSKRLFANTALIYTRYKYGFSQEEEEKRQNRYSRYTQSYTSSLEDLAAKIDMDKPGTYHYIRTGASATLHHFLPGTTHIGEQQETDIKDTVFAARRLQSREYTIYVEDDIRVTSKLKANIGMHASAYNTNEKWYTSVQPRVSLRYLITPQLSAKASYITMNQYIHLLTNSGGGLPTDLWVPATDKVPDEQSVQYAAGLAYTGNYDIEYTVEGYYKELNQVLDYTEGASIFSLSETWENRVVTGKGKSYGVEWMAQKKRGKLTGLIAYTWSRSTRHFEQLNEAKTFPYKYDRPHEFKLAANYVKPGKRSGRRTELGLDGIVSSGAPVTIPLQTYLDELTNPVEVYSARNGFRLPVYHRVDVSVSFYKKKPRWERGWVVGLYNVYNRRNPLYIYRENNQIKQVSMPGCLPTISYTVKF